MLAGAERLPPGERLVVLLPRLCGGEQLLAPDPERHAVAVEVVGRLLPAPGRSATDSRERWTRTTRESPSRAPRLNPRLGSVKVSSSSDASVGVSITGTRPSAAARSQSPISCASHVVRQGSSNCQDSPATVRTRP